MGKGMIKIKRGKPKKLQDIPEVEKKITCK
jgi:hypothetical protein